VNGQPQTPVNIVGGSASFTLTKPAAGTYAIDASFAGTGEQNLTANTLTVFVAPAPLTVTPINGAFRFYGAANPAVHGTVIGVVTGDGITANFSLPADLTTTSPVGTYPINFQLNDPNSKLSNYQVVSPNPPVLFSVIQAPLTLIALSESRPYGTADNPKFSVAGALPWDAASLTVTGTISGVTQNSPAGLYKNAITPIFPDPNDPTSNPAFKNYYKANIVLGSVTVTKAVLTVTALNQTRAVGAADPTFTVTMSGAPPAVLASDGITATATSTDTISSPAGSYVITPHVTENNPADPTNTQLANNYIVILKTGILTVAKAYTISGSLGANGAGATVTLSGASSATVMADASGNYSFAGLINGNYSVTPSAAGYTFTPLSQTVVLNGANATAVNFQ
jgi:hypothetical protein